MIDDAILDEWRRRLPEAEVVYYPEAGHYILEDETEAVCDRVENFLG